MADLAENATMLADYFEACVDALRTSNIKLMASVSRTWWRGVQHNLCFGIQKGLWLNLGADW